MADVLARIVARKRQEVAERLHGHAIEAKPTSRSLMAALRRPGARFIMEVKPKSPSGHVAKHDARAAVEAYRIADGLSVLTDEGDFGGSFDLLGSVRYRSDKPILAKDFIVDPAQVREARRHDADAVLAMMSVLDDEGARGVMGEAAALGMEVLVEVHDEAELERALDLGASFIGINNRDLKTLTTDLSVTERLAPLVPDHVLLISESGIAGHRDTQRLGPLVDGFLVGSSLMAAEDIDLAVRAMINGPTKICGLTRTEDVFMAASKGASHAGFIMVPGTPRDVPVGKAAMLAGHAQRAGMRAVGVFRDATIDQIADAARQTGVDAVQVHGGPDDLTPLRRALLSEVEIWDAGPPRDDAIRSGADRRLFDNGRGGTGRTFDWTQIRAGDVKDRAFLAGGIGPVNAEAARAVGTYGIDIGSAVEEQAGHKSRTKMEQLFAVLRAPARGEFA